MDDVIPFSDLPENFKKALELAPNFVGALLNLGRLYLENPAKDPNALRNGLAVYEDVDVRSYFA